MKSEFLVIEMYHSLMINNSFLRYLIKKGHKVNKFSFFKTEKKQFLSKKKYAFREGLCFIQLLFNVLLLRNKKVYCIGGFYAVLLIAKLFNLLLGPSFHLYIYNFYLHEIGERKLIKVILRFLLNNKYCTLIVQSPGEISYYQKLTSNQVFFVPYCADIHFSSTDKEINSPYNEYIFTGGYTNRDYGLALACAKEMKDIKFVFVVSSLNKDITKKSCPPNITLYEDVPNELFELLLSRSSAVLVPLKNDVGSSGQMLCISAMQNKKAIIYCDLSVVRYYFDANSGIPYERGNLNSLCKCVAYAMSDAHLRQQLGEHAFLNYQKHFTEEERNKKLYTIINQEPVK